MKSIFSAVALISLIVLIACSNTTSKELSAIELALTKITGLNDPHLNVDFPKQVGTKKTKVPIGGMMGSTANMELTTKVIEIDKDIYVITFIKDWNFKVNDETVYSYWKFRVEKGNVTLIEKNDKDDLMAIIG